MPELMQENGVLLIAALVIAVIILLWFFLSSRKTTVHRDNSADEGQSAKRNQALIDAPPATLKSSAPEQNADNPFVAVVEPVLRPVAEPVVKPVLDAVAAQEPEAPIPSGNDDLSRIKGVGPKLKTMLIDLGVTSFAEIAAWNDADIDRIDTQLGRFEGRIRRDNWPLQAKHLASGETAAYEAEFGKL